MRAGLTAATVRRVEQATDRLSRLSLARMDERLPWFRALPNDQREWVSLVAQNGLQSFVDWLRQTDGVRITGDVFGAAPSAMARSMALQQTVELVRVTIEVAEENLPELAGPAEAQVLHDELLRFSREIAFAAARVYARAAESRGSWDERLEALVVDSLVRGSEVGDPLASQLSALGWRRERPIVSVVGNAPSGVREVITEAHRLAQSIGVDVIAAAHDDRLIVVIGGVEDPLGAADKLLGLFGAGPVVVSPVATALGQASEVTQAALSGQQAARAWPGAPRPVAAEALLPERLLAGDLDARTILVQDIYRPLADAGSALLDTVSTFLDSGRTLEATARALFVHPNTVRYRLKRAAELCGESATEPRGALTLALALALGRLEGY